MLWSVKRAPPLFPIRWMPYFRPIWHPVHEYRIYIIYFCFVVTVIARFYLCDFGQIIIVLFRKFIKRDFIVYFKIVGNCSLINSVTFFNCMTGVFIGTFFGMISSAVTVPYSGWMQQFLSGLLLPGLYLKGIRYPAGLGSGDYSVFSIAWFLCIDCWYRAPHGREGDWHKASCLDRTSPGDGGHYHCVGGYYTVYYHFGRSAIFVQIYFSITGGKEHS